MSLNELRFVIVFVILLSVLAIAEAIKRKTGKGFWGRIQIGFLLIFSYYFVYCADWRFCLCIVVDTFIAYSCARFINRSEDVGKKRIFAIWGESALVGILVYFKYTNFFMEGFLKAFGLEYHAFKIILPLGISFFTFSALSYIIDVYRGKYAAEKNVIDFSLYMVFFPKITAGPIVRWNEFRPQLKEYRGIGLVALNDGVQIFVFGLFKKIVLADHLSVFVNDVYHAPSAYNSGTVVLAAISYSLQIYFDFSGYSEMAIGISKILGFEFKRNFNLPYIATGFSDFWKRWHISLSEWFRDYLYFPLGGSRKGDNRAYLNLLLVMLVSGLWHGAGSTFILWGLFHGMASCIERFIRRSGKKINKIFEIMVTFLFVTLFWTIFRADSIGNAFEFWKSMFTMHSGISQPYTWTFFSIVCLIIATFVAIEKGKNDSYINGFYPVLDLSKVWSMVLFFTFCGLTIMLGYFGNTAFVYGRF